VKFHENPSYGSPNGTCGQKEELKDRRNGGNMDVSRLRIRAKNHKLAAYWRHICNRYNHLVIVKMSTAYTVPL